MDKINSEFNLNKIKGVMAEKKITGEELAKVFGVHQNTIYRKLRGEHTIEVEELCEIANVLNVPVTYFFTVKMS